MHPKLREVAESTWDQLMRYQVTSEKYNTKHNFGSLEHVLVYLDYVDNIADYKLRPIPRYSENDHIRPQILNDIVDLEWESIKIFVNDDIKKIMR